MGHKGCLAGDVGITPGVPQIAAGLLHCQKLQDWTHIWTPNSARTIGHRAVERRGGYFYATYRSASVPRMPYSLRLVFA
jgi:hypothetical protein